MKNQWTRGSIALLVLCLLCGCGKDKKKQAQKSYLEAKKCNDAGRFERARILYEEALGYNPYHEQANLQLAALLETRFLETAGAIHYYKRFLDLSREDTLLRSRTKALVEVLSKVQKGVIEDPCYATEDLTWSARKNSMMTFSERLHVERLQDLTRLRKTVSHYFDFWKERTRNRTTKVIFRAILKNRGRYDAEVWVDIEEGKKLIERRRLRWRLEDTPCWELVGDETMKMTG